MSRRSSSMGRTLSEIQLGSGAQQAESTAAKSAKENTYLLAHKSDLLTYVNGNNVKSRLIRQIGFDYGSVSPRSVSLTHVQPDTSTRSWDQPSTTALPAAGHSASKHYTKNAATPANQRSRVGHLATTVSIAGSGRGGNSVDGSSSVPPRHPPHDCLTSGCRRLRINVSGQLYEIRIGVLNKHPKTLLGNRCKRRQFYDRSRKELFFDRHRPSFEAIFFYYQFGGMLRRPYHVPNDIFLDELLFYELEDDAVEEYKRSEGYTQETARLPSNTCMRKIWTLFEYPETSKAAFAVAVLSVVMTVVSIVLFCVETLPDFATSHCITDEAPNFLDPFFIIETTCTAWFTIELFARFLVCPDKFEFWKDFKNIVDVTAIVPYYVTLANVLSTMSCASAKSSASLSFLRVIRLVRIFKLTKHSVGLQILLMTFRASLEGLGLFLVALFVSLLVFSSAIYYAELGNPNSQMASIPDAFWWAIITMTTVGYGDKVPVGIAGKLVGAACAITGVLTLAIPVPIITGHFNRFYAHKTGRGRHI